MQSKQSEFESQIRAGDTTLWVARKSMVFKLIFRDFVYVSCCLTLTANSVRAGSVSFYSFFLRSDSDCGVFDSQNYCQALCELQTLIFHKPVQTHFSSLSFLSVSPCDKAKVLSIVM